MPGRTLQRLLLALVFLGGSAPSPVAVAEDTPASTPDAPAQPDASTAPGLPPPAMTDAAGTDTGAQAAGPDDLVILRLERMPASIQGCRRAIARGDYWEAIKRLEELKDKKLKDEELAAVTRMLDYAYNSGLEPRLKEIEQADPLKALQLFNLIKPPGSPDPYAPRFKDRIAALEAKVRSPEAQVLVKAGHEFNFLYDLFQTFPDDAKPKLEAFVAGHAADPYGAMAQRVLEGKPPVEETDLNVAGGVSPGAGLEQAQLAYPSEFGASKGAVPKNMAELRMVCVDFLAQSEKALKADTADAPECDAKFWKWVDSRPNIRTGLLLARNPVPAAFAINLAKCYKKLGDKACTKYGQLVLAGCQVEGDISIGDRNYRHEDISDNQRKMGAWLAQHADKVPLWRFFREPAKYAEQAGADPTDIGDLGKMAFASRTFPPRLACPILENLKLQILHQETRVPGTTWPIFPVARTPYILLRPVATCTLSRREHDFVWDLFCGRVGYPGEAEPGEQPGPPGKPAVGTMIGACKYGFEYTRPDVSMRRSLWHPNTVVRMLEDGGVCGRLATGVHNGNILLGYPTTTSGQPGHCSRMYTTFDGREFGADIDMGGEGMWMNVSPHKPLGLSPAISGHEGEAISWLALTRIVNRVGMDNYHASLVAAYRAQGATDPSQKRDWLELAVRLNPYHLPATEQIWQMAAQNGINSLNKAVSESILRLASNKAKTLEEAELDFRDQMILKRVAGMNISAIYDVAMDQAGNVSKTAQQEYKLGEGYQSAELTAEQKALARKAGLTKDPEAEIKEDLNLMFRYFLMFQKKGMLYGSVQEVFLKHLSRVNPEIGRKMLNSMLEDALKPPVDPKVEDPNDSPLCFVIKAIGEMDSKLDAKARSNGLFQTCDRIAKSCASDFCKKGWFWRHIAVDFVYGKTIGVPEPLPTIPHALAFDLLKKALREVGPDGVAKADKLDRDYRREHLRLLYQCAVARYKLCVPIYKDIVAKTHGAKLNISPPKPPGAPEFVFDKQGNLLLPEEAALQAAKQAAKQETKKPAEKPAEDSDRERERRGEGVNPE